MAQSKLVKILSLVSIIAGCSQGPTVTESAKRSTASSGNLTPGQQYQKPIQQPVGQLTPELALQKDVASAYNQLSGYSGILETIDKKGSKTIICKAAVKFRKPEQVRIDIQSNSDEPKQAGTKAVWSGGKTLKVRPSGILGFAKVDLPTTDSRVLTQNGWRIDQISLRANVMLFLDQRTKVKILGDGKLGNLPLVFTEVVGPFNVQGIDRMKMGFDRQSKLPLTVDFLQGSSSVYSIRLLNMQLRSPSPSEFEL
ncbi:MAG: hypothetical protein HY692_00675 [Cyanobacteria bacterium NC_groundwater_1444_Ag_S-0.65um_54_12]|nr:hypothetical protein [Cyanobacteria bacterium NC_groundwater_1444_Ag_S-0.65um_54_12]